jgi:hypothetical protein
MALDAHKVWMRMLKDETSNYLRKNIVSYWPTYIFRFVQCECLHFDACRQVKPRSQISKLSSTMLKLANLTPQQAVYSCQAVPTWPAAAQFWPLCMRGYVAHLATFGKSITLLQTQVENSACGLAYEPACCSLCLFVFSIVCGATLTPSLCLLLLENSNVCVHYFADL